MTRLAIDFGTSNTVAVLRRPDGTTSALLFDGSPLLPSAICATEQGIVTGRDAMHLALHKPASFEANPKRRLADGGVWLGQRNYEVVELVGAVLARVRDEAVRVAGGAPTDLVMTHPADWSQIRCTTLAEAAAHAGLPTPRLIPEPVAAAIRLHESGGPAPPGPVVIYDFGAGTFDVSVVDRDQAGDLRVRFSECLSDVGGLDIDDVVVAHLGRIVAGRSPEIWHRLRYPDVDSEGDRRARWQLADNVRQAKEQLSRRSSTYVHIPLLESSVTLVLDEFNQLARPLVDRTVQLTREALRRTGLAGQPVRICLVGGSSRLPLAATRLHQELGIAPWVGEQPELIVAEGAARAPAARPVEVPDRQPHRPEQDGRQFAHPTDKTPRPAGQVDLATRLRREAVDPAGLVLALVFGAVAGWLAVAGSGGTGVAALAGLATFGFVYTVRTLIGAAAKRKVAQP